MSYLENNSLIEKAEQLANKEVTLKDLYLDQLLTDILSEEDFEDVERDDTYYVEGDIDYKNKFASFDLTSNIMSNVEKIAKAKVTQTQVNNEAPTATILVDLLKPQENLEVAEEIEVSYSDSTDNNLYSENQSSSAVATLKGGRSNPQNNSKKSVFSLGNLAIFALGAVIAVGCINFNKNSESNFSTLASKEDSNNIATLELPTVNNFASTITIEQLAKNSNVTNYPLTPFKFDQGYKPIPISEGIKLVGLKVRVPLQGLSITVTSDKAKNLNIILFNYEFQKRLVTR